MAGEEKQIIDRKGTDAKYHLSHIRRKSDGIYLQTRQEELSFPEMMERRKPVDPTDLEAKLKEGGAGHELANVGVSALLSILFEKQNFLLLVRQERTDPDFQDIVLKNVSGYVPILPGIPLEHLPLATIKDEIAEEVLFITGDKGVIPGHWNGEPLPRPFEDKLEYTGNGTYFMYDQQPAHFEIPGLAEPVYIDCQPTEGYPKLHVHAPTNGTQLIYSRHIFFPTVKTAKGQPLLDYLAYKKASAEHTEDKFAEGKLNVVLDRKGLVLAALDEQGRIKGEDEMYNLVNGKLVRYSSPYPINLSEAFAPMSEASIISKNHISLEEYLRTQE